MKNLPKLLIAILCIMISQGVMAQYESSSYNNNTDDVRFYLDLSTGINNHSGLLGVGLLFPINEQLALRGGVGVGAWGSKISGSIKVGNRTTNGWTMNLGYSHCQGLENFPLTITDATNNTTTTSTINLLPKGSFNISLSRNWVLRNNSIFFIEGGYAAPTGGSKSYEYISGDPLPLLGEQVLSIMRPGGLIVALGIQIAF